jgi:hypothetical protein
MTGLPLAVVQIWGWGTMFLQYAEQMPTSTALAYTLSGQELCGYCQFVDEAAEIDWQAEHLKQLTELRLLPLRAVDIEVGYSPTAVDLRNSSEDPLDQHRAHPPVPPPRVA